jgi:hypothetical protein
MPNLIAHAAEVDELAHRASAMGFDLDAKAEGKIEDALFNIHYIVSKDSVIVMATNDQTWVRQFIILLELQKSYEN